MKKLSIILAAMLAMTSFAGCQKKEEEKKADTSKPEAIVEKYCDDLLANDLGDYEDYFSEDADVDKDEFAEGDLIGAMMADMPSEYEDFWGEKEVEKVADAILETAEYEIAEVEEDGDESKVTVATTMADTDAFGNIDGTELVLESMGLDPETATEEDLYEALEKYGLDENSTEEEVMEAIADDMIDYIIDMIKDADTVENESVYTVVKNDDGEWRIKKIKD